MKAALFALVAFLALTACHPRAPAAVERELAQTPKDRVLVVFFTDFQCPFCRRTHRALERVLASRPGAARVVLKHVPLRRHPDADDAARTAICAERLGGAERGARVADAMVVADDLAADTREAIVLREGIALEAFRSCLVDSATDQRLRDDAAEFLDAGGDGVPLLFVGRERLDGAQDVATLERAIDGALR